MPVFPPSVTTRVSLQKPLQGAGSQISNADLSLSGAKDSHFLAKPGTLLNRRGKIFLGRGFKFPDLRFKLLADSTSDVHHMNSNSPPHLSI